MNNEGRETLLGFATLLNIETTKRQLCFLMQDYFFTKVVGNCNNLTDYDTNLYGDLIRDLPQWRIFVIDNVCFDIFDLKMLVDNGQLHPTTRQQLPTDKINQRVAQLNKLSNTSNLFSTDGNQTLLERVADSQIYTAVGELANLTRILFQDFEYFNDITIVTNASDATIDSMVDKLIASNANSVLQIQTTHSRIVKSMTGVKKKLYLVKVLLESLNDGDKNSKTIILESAFVSFSRKRRRENDDFGDEEQGEDMFEMMIE